jgi:phosphotransferase system HPr (HPr) family protein
MLTAARLVRLAQGFHSRILLRLGTRMADARSIISLMLLSATLGTSLEIEAAGNDEHEAVQAVEEFFASQRPGDRAAAEN